MMNQPLLAAVSLALLGALLVPVQIAAGADEPKIAEAREPLPGAAGSRQGNHRALPAPVWSREEQWAYRKLAQPNTVDFLDLPLEDGVTFLKEYHNFPIQFDEAAIKAAKISISPPVTMKLDQVPFQLEASISSWSRTTSTGTLKDPISS